MSSHPSSAPSAAPSGKTRDLYVVERVLGGDAEIFGRLVARYGDVLTQYAFAMTGSRAAAVQCVDEGFVMAFRALAKIPERGNFLPFVLRAVRRHVYDVLPGVDPPDPVQSFDAAVVLESVVAGRLTADVGRPLLSMLRHLPVALREAWVLRYVVEADPDEQAYATSVAPPVLAQRVAEANAALVAMAEQIAGEAPASQDGSTMPQDARAPVGSRPTWPSTATSPALAPPAEQASGSPRESEVFLEPPPMLPLDAPPGLAPEPDEPTTSEQSV